MDWEPHFSDPDDFQHAQVPQLVKNHFFVIVVWCLIHVGLDAAHVPGLGRLKNKTTTGHQNSDIFESRGGYSRVLIRRHIFTPVPKDRLVWLAIINGVFHEKLFSILTMEVLVKALSLKKSDFMMIIVNRNSSCCDLADFQCMKIFSMILSLLLAKLSSGPLVCTQYSKKSTVSYNRIRTWSK